MNAMGRDEFTNLVKAAGVKLRLQRELRYVPEEITDWQDRDFLAVTNRSGNEGVLVAPLDGQHVAVFGLQKRTANSTGRVEAIICDLCATWQRGSNSAVMTFEKERSSVSFLVCADLACSAHVRGKTAAATLSRAQLREDISVEGRVERLRDRLTRIVAEAKM